MIKIVDGTFKNAETRALATGQLNILFFLIQICIFYIYIFAFINIALRATFSGVPSCWFPAKKFSIFKIVIFDFFDKVLLQKTH